MSRTPSGRIAALDGWRGLAALAVVVLHALGGSALRDLPWVLGANVWVDFFFVLSGFVLAGSIARASGSLATARVFIGRRCRRLLPSFHAALGGLVLVVCVAWVAERVVHGDSTALTGGEEPWRIIPAAVMLAPLLAPTVGAIGWLSPGWSVAVELWVNLGLVAILALLGRRVALSAAVVAVTGTAIVAVAYLHDPSSGQSVGLYAVGRGMAGIGVGIVLSRWASGRDSGSNVIGALQRLDGLAVVVALATVLAYGVWGNAVLLAAPYCLAFVVVQQAHSRGRVARLMTQPVPQLLGALSYSVYLWHQPVLYAVRETSRLGAGVGDGPVPTLWALGIAGATVALTLLVAFAARRLIEVPATPAHSSIPRDARPASVLDAAPRHRLAAASSSRPTD